MSELRNIPNVGKQTERDLTAMGYTTIDSLRGKRAEELYEEENEAGLKKLLENLMNNFSETP